MSIPGPVRAANKRNDNRSPARAERPAGVRATGPLSPSPPHSLTPSLPMAWALGHGYGDGHGHGHGDGETDSGKPVDKEPTMVSAMGGQMLRISRFMFVIFTVFLVTNLATTQNTAAEIPTPESVLGF